MAVGDALKDICRHCNKAVIFWLYDEDGQPHYGRKPLWYHLPGGGDDRTVVVDLKQGELRRYCKHYDQYTYAEPKNFCVERQYGGDVCNRPVKDEQFMMCGMHARKEQDKKDALAKQVENRDTKEYLAEAMQTICLELKEKYAINAEPHSSSRWSSDYDGKIVVEPSELMEVLRSGYKEG